MKKKVDINFLKPSEQQLNSLLKYYQSGRYEDAEKLSLSITQEFPEHQFTWKVLGATLKQMGKINESLIPGQKSVQLNPQDSEASYNLGSILQELDRLDEAETSYRQAITLKPDFTEAYNNLGVVLQKLGRLDEAEACYRQAITSKPDFIEAHYNLGLMLKELGRLDEAEASYRQAITLKPDFTESYNNLGVVLQKLGKLKEGEASYRQAITLKPNFTEAYNNLGVILRELGRLDEAEASYRQAITLKPDYAEAHYNLGVILQKLSRLDEAEEYYRQAITLKPDYAEAHNNLANISRELGRLDEAEASYRQAITLKPDYAEAHNNLANISRELGRLDEAEASYRQAITFKPDYAEAHVNLELIVKEKVLLHKIFYKKKTMGKDKVTDVNSGKRLTFNPFISHRDVEIELLKDLYKVNFKKLDMTESKDARYGNGRCSDFEFFENGSTMIKTVEEDLISIMKQAVKSDIYIMDSFLNIFGAGSGTVPHKHISNFDKNQGLANQKFSLTYYLSVGDQNCSEPGNLKVYEPNDEILLSNGTVVILPAFRNHSSVYNGKKDRVMIGVNFYSLS